MGKRGEFLFLMWNNANSLMENLSAKRHMGRIVLRYLPDHLLVLNRVELSYVTLSHHAAFLYSCKP